jgi:hypothetical protein
LAAQYYVQPAVSVTAENDTNLDLDPGAGSTVQGYLIDAASVLGVATPDASFNIRPRLVYRDYPKDSPDNRLEEYLDINSEYRSVRSSASIYGTLEHRDEFNAEQNSALFNDFNPGQPVNADTGRTTVGATRDSAYFVPSYTYKLTPLWSAGVSGVYQMANYSPSDDSSHIDYNYYLGRAFLGWTVSQKSELSFGGFASKYDAKQYDSHETGTGAQVDYDTNWTELLSSKLTLVYQRTSIDTLVPHPFNGDVNAWGATANVTYKTQVSALRLIAGRTIAPSGGGSLYAVDQIKVQYDRTFTARFSATGAVLYLRDRGLTANISGDNRNYLQTVMEAKYMLTPTWYLSGGYQYAWEKYQFDTSGAANNRIYITIGYLGRGIQR